MQPQCVLKPGCNRDALLRRGIPLRRLRHTGHRRLGPIQAPPVASVKPFTTQKGSMGVMHDQYMYVHRRTNQNGRVRWRCRRRTCGGELETASDLNFPRVVSHHNHQQISFVNVHNEESRQSVKRKAAEEPTAQPSKLICQAIRNSEGCYTMANYSALSKVVYRQRRKLLPGSLSKSLEQSLVFLEEMGQHKGLEITVDKESKIVMFVNKQVITSLSDIETVYCDGTFQCAPKFFHQLYTFTVLQNGYYVPVVHFLLKDKKAQTYKIMLRMFLSNFKDNFNLQNISIDFESGMLAAVRAELPAINIHCCRFHLGQSLLKNIKKYGLMSNYYNKHDITGLWLKSLLGLAAIEPCRIHDYYFQHKDSFETNLLPELDAQCLKLFQDYFEKYYVGENSVFPPKIWAGLMGKNEIRYTNNGSEAFHSALGRRFCGITNQPNVFSVLEVLSDFQTINILKLQSDKALKKNQFDDLSNELYNLLSGNISIQVFLKIVSRKYRQKLPIVYAPITMSHISIFYYL